MKPVKCACCDHFFIPRANNREKQKYCNAPACQNERNRIKNQTYRTKKENDFTFKHFEAQRQQRIRDRRKELNGKREARRSSTLNAFCKTFISMKISSKFHIVDKSALIMNFIDHTIIY
ncbi:MAG: hypothetical protein PHG96_03615 [Kiritimatiellae bacterium]|jgi:hypothetical protein|nr:hypothetical protein [Kiritimatiellia bacterium]